MEDLREEVVVEVKATAAVARVEERVVVDKGLLHLLKTIKVTVKVEVRVAKVAVKVAAKVEGVKVVEIIKDQKRTTSKSGSSIMIIVQIKVVILKQFYSRLHNKILASHNGTKTNGRTSGLIM